MEVILQLVLVKHTNWSINDKSMLVQTFVYVLLSNLFLFGQTIDVSIIKLYDYLRWCMKFNMAKCERYVPIKFWVAHARVKSIVLANKWLIYNYFMLLFFTKEWYFWGNITVFYLFNFNIIASFWTWHTDYFRLLWSFSFYLLLNKDRINLVSLYKHKIKCFFYINGGMFFKLSHIGLFMLQVPIYLMCNTSAFIVAVKYD